MRTTRWLPVLVVLLTAPWFAEMAWGGFPVSDVPLVLLFLAPLYGTAALLAREVARRTGRGWPAILLLAAAFGVLQAGVVDQSLFNPAYGRFDFQHPAHVDGVDVSLFYLLAFVTGHVVASIATPVFLAERWTTRSTEPWLSRRATWTLGIVYALASLLNHVGVKDEEGGGFQARPEQTLAALAVVAALVAAALLWRRWPATSVAVPAPWVLAVGGFAGYLLYLPHESTAGALVGVVVVAAVVVTVGRWSRSAHWRAEHAMALAGGAVLVGLVSPFLGEPYEPSADGAAELAADASTVAVTAAVLVVTALRHRHLTRAVPSRLG